MRVHVDVFHSLCSFNQTRSVYTVCGLCSRTGSNNFIKWAYILAAVSCHSQHIFVYRFRYRFILMEFVQCTDMMCASHSLGYWTYPYAVITFIFFKSLSRMISLILLRFGCCILVLFISLFQNVLKLSFHKFSVFFFWCICVIEMNQNRMHTVFYDRNNKNESRQLEVVIIIYSYKNTLTLRRFGSQSQFICALADYDHLRI